MRTWTRRGLPGLAALAMTVSPGVPARASAATDGYDLLRSLSPTTVVGAGFAAREARVDPTGVLVAFVGPGPGGREALYVKPVDGGRTRTLVSGSFDVGAPCFSGDGATLYFHSNEKGPEKIFKVSVEGGEREQLTFGPSHDLHPSVSADGRRLAFDSDREGGYDVWLLEDGSAAPRRVTMDPAPDFYPALHPDGSRVAFTSGRKGGWHIWAKPLDGGAAYPLSRGSAADAHPAVSWDGHLVAFDSDRSGREELWVTPWKGGGPVKVPTSAERSRYPSFLPGSTRLLFTAETRSVSTVEWVEVPAHLDPPAARSARRPARPAAPGSGPSTATATPARRPAGEDAASPDAAGVRIASFQPTDRETGVGPGTSIFVAFGTPVSPTESWQEAVELLEEGGGPVAFEALYNPGLHRLEVQPTAELPPSRSYRVRLRADALRGGGGEAFDGFEWVFRRDERSRARPVVVDAALTGPFEVRGVAPAPDTGGVDPGTRVAVRFTRPFDPRTLGEDALVLRDASGRRVPGELRMVARDTTVVLTPYERLGAGREYRAELARGILAADGSALETRRRDWSFRTRHTGSLRIAGIEPADGVLEPDAALTLTFHRPVLPASLETGELLLQGGGLQHRGNMVLDSTRTLLLFQPYSRLPPGTEFVLHLPAGLSDADGNPLDLDEPLRFRTEGAAPARNADALLARHLGTVEGEVPGDRLGGASATTGAGEVPRWTVAVLRSLHQKGYLDPALAGNLEHAAVLTRYKTAMLVDSARRRAPAMTSHERAALRRLESEFSTELSRMGRTLAGTPAAAGAGE